MKTRSPAVKAGLRVEGLGMPEIPRRRGIS